MIRRLKVVIADDHLMFTEGIKWILERRSEPAVKVIGVAANGNEALEMVINLEPDLLFLDLNMPVKDGIDVLIDIKRMHLDVKVIALTMYNEVKLVKTAFKEGVDGYLLKSSSADELFLAINEVMDDQTYFGKGVNIVPRFGSMDEEKIRSIYQDKFIRKYNLTKREIEVLLLISHALSNKEIAKELYISDQTVSVHRKNLMRKLGVSNTAALIRFAFDKSLI